MDGHSLADQIIQARETHQDQRKDDLGLPIPDWFTQKDYSPDYLAARTFLLHPQIYFHNTLLWEHGEYIEENATTLASLARWPHPVSPTMLAVVWDRIRELAPRLDPTRIAITSDLIFNMSTGEFEKNSTMLRV